MNVDIAEFFSDLDAGIFEKKLSEAISEVATAVVDHDKKGSVSINLDIKRIGNSAQVTIDHKLTFSRPTSKGKVSEENTTKTPMYVGPKGSVTLFPEGQGQMFTKAGEVSETD